MKNLVILVATLAGVAVSVNADFCYVCSMRTEPNCLIPEPTSMLRDCSSANNYTCFTRIVNREVERGCSATLSREDFANCNNETSCMLCQDTVHEGRCNGAVFPEHRLHCHQCSGPTNGTCGEEIVSTPTLCRLFAPEDQCYVRVDDGQVERGCLSESDFCRVGATCHVCDGNGCNYKHFESGAMGLVISVKTIVMALLAAMVYDSLRQ